MNKVVLIGRLASTPQLYNSKNLTSYARATIAVARDLNKDETDFISLIAFTRNATFLCTYFSKGDLVAIDGNISASRYKNDKGEYIESTSVIIQNVRSLEPREITNKRREQNGLAPVNTAIFNNPDERPIFADEKKDANKSDDESDNSPWELDF